MRPRTFPTARFVALATLVLISPRAVRPAPPPLLPRLALGLQVGSVDFPNSCSAEVQGTIKKGLALLHSFQYEESARHLKRPRNETDNARSRIGARPWRTTINCGTFPMQPLWLKGIRMSLERRTAARKPPANANTSPPQPHSSRTIRN